MKKKSISILLATLLTISTVAGCGSKDAAATRDNAESAPAAVGDNADYGYYPEYEVTADVAEGAAAEEPLLSPAGESPTSDNWGSDTLNIWDAESTDSTASKGMANDVYEPYINTESYNTIKENGFTSVAENPLSTFSADVDTASYANMRRMIRDGYSAEYIPEGSIRTEELINYFDYEYIGPKSGEPFGVNAVISECPWNEDSKLLMMGLQTQEIPSNELPDSNIVFLIDTSGSMYSDDKLPLLQEAFELLVEEGLDKNDRVSIVTYAGSSEVVLQGVPGNKKDKIIRALRSLEASGSTNGSEGIVTAYEIAEEYFIENGNNRVIIASDGDMNVGLTTQEELCELIEKKRESGVFLSVLGFGTGNYKDSNMETLADSGNGNYSYIDCMEEAEKVLIDELSATLLTVAKDVKFQIEFNPAVVSDYRLIGYENRVMNAQDFADDTKDAGEIGAGHSVTVMYELTLCEDEKDEDIELRYQESQLTERALESDEWLTLAIRYKKPNEDESRLLEYPVGSKQYDQTPPDDFYFAAAVAEFGMYLNDSDYLADGGLNHTYNCLAALSLSDEYRKDFHDMVETIIERENDPYYEDEFYYYY